jgi:hypothetical protein
VQAEHKRRGWRTLQNSEEMANIALILANFSCPDSFPKSYFATESSWLGLWPLEELAKNVIM